MPKPKREKLEAPREHGAALDFVVWQSQQHFNFSNPWEHVEFAVYATFDVVARPGWRLTQFPQTFSELWIVREGGVEIIQEGHHALAQAPCVALIRSGQSRDTRQIGPDSLSILGFSFTATLWGALDFLDFLPLEPVLPQPSARLEELATLMVDESKQQFAGHSLAVQGLGQLALVELWRSHGISATVPATGALHLAEHGELSGALQLVQTRFHEPLDVEQLARACHLSTKHFGRKFRDALGLTPMEYLRRVRLNQARGALASSEAPVGTIARQCGFEDSAHFSRAFKTHWGASPLEFRRTLRQTMRTS